MAVTFQQLEIFRAVAQNLSFSVAAREVYTSQPHVSNQIRKLEEHYRVPLFVRSHPGVALTEAGVALYERVNRVLDGLAEAEQEIQQFRGLQHGTVRVAATQSSGNHLVPGIVASFAEVHPGVMVQVQVSNTEGVIGALESDDAELGIIPRRPQGRFLTAEPLYSEELVVIYPIAMDLPNPLPVADFSRLPKIAREEGSLTLSLMEEVLGSGEHTLVAQLTGTTAVNEAVAAGLGVSLVPKRSAHAWVAAGSIATARLDGVQPRHNFDLVHSKQRYVTPAARALIEHFRSSLHP